MSSNTSSQKRPPATTPPPVRFSVHLVAPVLDSAIMIIDSGEIAGLSSGKPSISQLAISKTSSAKITHQAMPSAETSGATSPVAESWHAKLLKTGVLYAILQVDVVVQNNFQITGNCKKLLARRDVREVFVREDKELNLERSANVEPTLGHSRGEIEEEECNGCAKCGGPFTDCVTVEGILQGSCRSCHFSSSGVKGSFRIKPSRKWAEKEANMESEKDEDYGRSVRGRKKRNINLTECFGNIGTLMNCLAEEFMQIAKALE